MNKIISAVVAILFLCSTNSVNAQSTICQYFELNEENIDTYVGQFSDYYNNYYSFPYPSFDEARGPLTNFLLDQITNTGYSSDCYPGKFWYSGYNRETVEEDILTHMYFRWGTDTPSESQHSAKLYDFMIGEVSEEFTADQDDQGIKVSSKNLNLKLLLLNTNCAVAGQSKAYAMIIIDRDIHIPSVTGACVPDNPGITSDPGGDVIVAPRKMLAANSLKVFPNPNFDSPTTLDFNLTVDQKISIQLVEASSGKMVSQLLNENSTRAGNHVLELPSNNLNTGLYYVILQTEKEKIVKKLVKM